MKEKRKLPYSVTLFPEVAEALCALDEQKGKLTVGVARAQALLALPGVMEFARKAEAEDRERYNEGLRLAIARHQVGGVMPGAAELPLEQLLELYAQDYVRRERNRRTAGFKQSARDTAAENERLEQQAEQLVRRVFAASAAAFHAGEPLPLHEELNTPELRNIRTRVFERCTDAFGWAHGPAPRPSFVPAVKSAPALATIATSPTDAVVTTAAAEAAQGSPEAPDTRTLDERIEDVFGEPDGAAKPLPEAHQGPTEGDVTGPPEELHGSDSSSVQEGAAPTPPLEFSLDSKHHQAGADAIQCPACFAMFPAAASCPMCGHVMESSATPAAAAPDQIGEPTF